MSPRTSDDLIAAGGIPAIVYVIVVVIVDAPIDTGAIPHGQNSNYSWSRTNSCLLNDNAAGNGAPLVNDASRSGQTRNERCEKKNGFHGLRRCSRRIAAAEDAARIAASAAINRSTSVDSSSTLCLRLESKNLWKLSGGF
jgi:hypothetical protein